MRTRRFWLPGIALTLVALVALAIAGLHPEAVRTATAHAPNNTTVAVLHPGRSACEGPLVSQRPARSVAVWGASVGSPARLTVSVRNATTHALLASGPLLATPAEAEWTSRLARAVPGGRPLQICLTGDVSGFALAGSGASAAGLVATGTTAGQRFSLDLLSDADRSLFASLPTAFSRASLWRPSWVGSWTFWVLAIALLATFGLAVVAVTSAASADDDPEGRPAAAPNDEGPPPHAGQSGPSENRPRVVT
jgi:hypothetical protein